jgi:hypothetical protein
MTIAVNETFKRLGSHANVLGVVIIDRVGRVVKAAGSKSINEANFIAAISNLLTKINLFDRFEELNTTTMKTTDNLSTEVDNNGDELEDGNNENDDISNNNDRPRCIRFRFDKTELIVSPNEDFALCVLQQC